MQLSNAQMVELMALGAIIGMISGMIGIGGGVLVIPALVVFVSATVHAHPRGGHKPGDAASADWDLCGDGALPAGECEHPRGGDACVRVCNWRIFRRARRRHRAGKNAAHDVRVFPFLYVAGMVLFRLERRVWAVLQTVAMIGAFAIAYIALRATGKRLERQLDLSAEYRARLAETLAPDYEI